jgi:threonine dehydrogenase-like Zn-dependent dehydrogenase
MPRRPLGQCTAGGGWILGNLADGTQVERVRVPFADTSTYPVPSGVSDEQVLMQADILPTATRSGRVANIGAHGRPARLDLDELWMRDITVTTGLDDTYSTPTLMRLLTSSRLDASRFVTHHFSVDRFMEAYEVLTQSAETRVLKVVLTPDGAA